MGDRAPRARAKESSEEEVKESRTSASFWVPITRGLEWMA